MMNPVPWLQMTNMISYQGLVRTFPNLQAARDFALITTNSYTSVLKKYQATVTAGAATQQDIDELNVATTNYLKNLPIAQAQIDAAVNTAIKPNPVAPKAPPKAPPITASTPALKAINVPLPKSPAPQSGNVTAPQQVTATPTQPLSVAGTPGATGPQGVAGKKGAQGATGAQGVQGAPGKNGVTTTIIKKEIDTASLAQIKALKAQNQTQTQDLNAARSALQAMSSSSNQHFKNLSEEVDNNKKHADAGISGAMAMAGLPQVQTNQQVMFSAGGATYEGESALAVGGSVNFNEHVVGKVSFSADTADNMGASIGVGVGF